MNQFSLGQPRLRCIVIQAFAPDGVNVGVQQAVVQQGANYIGCSACRVKMVYVGTAIGIHPGYQGGDGGQVTEVFPVDNDPGGPGDSDPVNAVVGGAASGQQGDDGVNNAFLVYYLSQWCVFLTQGGDFAQTLRGFYGELLAQLSTWCLERGARYVQAHRFH